MNAVLFLPAAALPDAEAAPAEEPPAGESGEALAETEGGEAEWTVLFYMCGSDLESKYSYATQNLAEIKGVKYPMDERVLIKEILEEMKK